MSARETYAKLVDQLARGSDDVERDRINVALVLAGRTREDLHRDVRDRRRYYRIEKESPRIDAAIRKNTTEIQALELKIAVLERRNTKLLATRLKLLRSVPNSHRRQMK